jgi:hypothetical protein
MSRPTEQASFKFGKAQRFADQAGGFYQVTYGNGNVEKGNRYLSAAVRELADGLQHLSVGIRAIYILLEEVKNGPRR